ncbi:MAG TPA: glycosyltransferase family 4 protein [Steroidobacteraceae bacterium]|jgi:glycosyltransferase involved in cell wall biosynthesis
MIRKLAIVCTHPIQYYAPVFRALSGISGLDVRVFYTWSQAANAEQFDSGFGRKIAWDIPLLEGYAYQFAENVAERPGVDHFRGLRTPTLTRDIENWGADALLVYTWNSHAHLQAMRHFKGRLPVLFRGDSNLIDPRPRWRAAARRMALTWIYRHIDVAVAVGSHNRDYFAWCGIPGEHITIAPHSVDVVRFAAEDSAQLAQVRRWRDEFGISPEAPVILFAGKLQPKKNPRLLLDAFAGLEAFAHLVFVGDGELQDELLTLARSVPRVHFLPFQNQSLMPAVYRLGDLFVLPSQGPEETWGLALNEAMASGRAIIASTRVGATPDLIEPGTTGWSFESGDLLGLRGALSAALAQGVPRLHAMGRQAQARSSGWSSEASAERIAEAVLGVLDIDNRSRVFIANT